MRAQLGKAALAESERVGAGARAWGGGRWGDGDYDKSLAPDQLGMKERERGQELARGPPRWNLPMRRGETWSII